MKKMVAYGTGLVVLVVIVLLGIIWFWPTDPVVDCLDAGGRWVEEIGECECTYEDRGNHDIHITDEEYAACRKEIPNAETNGEELE